MLLNGLLRGDLPCNGILCTGIAFAALSILSSPSPLSPFALPLPLVLVPVLALARDVSDDLDVPATVTDPDVIQLKPRH